jgi:hypothetical protein
LPAVNLAGLLVNLGGVFQVIEGDIHRIGFQAARVAPETAKGVVSLGYGFLCLFVEVLAEIGAGSHVPVNPVALILVEAKGDSIARGSDPTPCLSQLETGFLIRGNGQENVIMRGVALLKLHEPEIADAGNQAANGSQPGVEM